MFDFQDRERGKAKAEAKVEAPKPRRMKQPVVGSNHRCPRVAAEAAGALPALIELVRELPPCAFPPHAPAFPVAARVC